MINYVVARTVLLLMFCFFYVPSVDAASTSTGGGINKIYRIFHFVLRNVDFDSAKKMLVQAHSSGFNTIQLTLSDGVRLKHAPWKAQRDAWTKSQLIEWSNLANSLGMEVIPQLALLTHQQKFFQNNYPELMYSKGIYDPRNEQTYVKVFAVLQEVIDIFHRKAIHIGHDEVAGWILPATTFYKKDRRIGLGKGEEVFPAELFLDDVLKLKFHRF